ncbi:UvrD-helicase domain-containing protein [Stenotrophomonas sp. S39]|uniref:UvrD-helicase domain-containing protein n=1 Tax=Stenotrophomonas sp. S39 TaxID=2767451 RepID=UPI00190D4CCA|nr:UvrD-helicase domain-containing protein [Stenotrophomonas sp. S39]MBK0052630.1 UvrD-helicase domain-containing protein [Stenotrophomonas sp. S39]
MTELELDIFASRLGSVIAPAGCGKTQLIADSLRQYKAVKPVLVLTHTNAGRAALDSRMERAGVPRSAYRSFTIDSWAGRVASRFPLRTGVSASVLRHENKALDYPAIRQGALRVLQCGDINDVLAATYHGVIVDEYQDCSLAQHGIIRALSAPLPVCVLGDPLQAIFGFREPTVDWDLHVRADFPSVGCLSIPWRWRRVGAEALGEWLLDVRRQILAGSSISLDGAPRSVRHIPLSAIEKTANLQRMEAARTRAPNKDGSVLVIGRSETPETHRKLASATFGASVVESLDLRDLSQFAASFEPTKSDSLQALLDVLGEMMTNLGGAELRRRLETLRAGRAKKPASQLEAGCINYLAAPSFEAASVLVEALEASPDVRVYRYEALRVLKSALQLACGGSVSFYEAVVRARESNRHTGRRAGRVAVGSTLLLKGLEADMAVVLHAGEMDPKNLYVALTRGSRGVVVCSKASRLL